MHTHPQITAKFTWSPEDYQKYCGLQSKLSLLNNCATFLIFAFLGVCASWFIIDSISNSGMIAIGTCFFIWLVFVHPWQTKRRFRQLRLGEHENKLVISDAGIAYDAVTCKSEMDWDMFQAHNENDSHAVLWINRWQGICIPKRAFVNDTDLKTFRHLAHTKISGKTFA